MADEKYRKFIPGWEPDVPDDRDFAFRSPLKSTSLPPSVDLRSQMPPVYDQGALGSCTANAVGAAFHFEELKAKSPDPIMPSRLFIYYNTRVIEDSVNEDKGAQIRNVMKTVSKQGIAPEKTWKYDIGKFAQKPTDTAYQEATKNVVTLYSRVDQDLDAMKGCLAEGFPFVFGFRVYDNFESVITATTGVLGMPNTSGKAIGGHAVVAVGYNDETKQFIIRNSWGNNWGKAGYFLMPYAYLTDSKLASDFWTIRQSSEKQPTQQKDIKEVLQDIMLSDQKWKYLFVTIVALYVFTTLLFISAVKKAKK